MRKKGDKNKIPAMLVSSIRMPKWVFDYFDTCGKTVKMREILEGYAKRKVKK